MSTGLVAGLDLGTSRLKGVVADPSGRVVAAAAEPYPTSRTAPGAAEQDPADWERALRVVLQRLARTTDASAWSGIGLSAMIPTLVTLDADGHPVGPAITWEDARATAEGDAFRERVGGDDLYRRTGQWVDGRYLLPMFARIRRDEPDRVAATVAIAGAKDHLHELLTGRLVTDPSTATGFGCFDLSTGDWDEGLLGAALGDAAAERPRLPEVEPSAATTPLRDDLAEAYGLPTGIPVSLGAADSVCGALSLGATRPGNAAVVAGTSSVILGIAGEPRVDPRHRFLVTPLARQGWGLEMDLVSTGSAVAWLASLLGMADEADVVTLAAGAEPGARGVVFLPFLGAGEQGALWDPSLRGTLAGLTLSHEPGDVARALLEGIVLETRRCLGVLAGASGPAGDVAVAGWMSSAPLPQWLADATGREVRAATTGSGGASALGAALVAVGEEWSGAAGDGTGSPESEDPDAVRHPTAPGVERWAELWARHERVVESVRLAANDDREESVR
ncbi:MAG TPA: FGGY-family carbohydrate kinase [Actinomycetota bacterium]|nr:FGGY-family carbohydrate kinase [Actinomycetota bacterium]